MNFLVIICFIIWIYLLWVFHRGDLYFFKFFLGSVGLFLFIMIWIQPILTPYLIRMVSGLTGILGDLTGTYDSYYEYGMLFINNKEAIISLYIDYECSGILEIMAFTALLWFFPIYNFYEKVSINIVGAIWITIANVIRVFSICLFIYYGGNDMFYFAHTLFGRMIFYIMSIILYFYVFTRGQIVRQKVGRFNYEYDT